ncbi:MAG TPA: sigma-70 family RNA polymerase sigma factor [Ktedonobacterales bacterium]|nr:sigma-70 family RNA polymerase sigma factor [Ktedonobacterales bacterium]
MHPNSPSAPPAHPQAHHVPLVAELNERLAAERPRLLRLARRQGLPPEAAEEVVQETLLDAWRALESLREPERFEAWLAGICRRRSLMHLRHDAATRRGGRATHLPLDDVTEEERASGLRGPSVDDLDPAAELERQDLHALLDRALAHLNASAREALALCYLDELPQAEAALRLGLTVAALESRLHRARRQLRAVLAGTLRADAVAFGLPLDEEATAGWQESRLWCVGCGTRRLRGIFEPLPSGEIGLRMRCSGCGFQINSGGVPLGGLRSFRPAVNRMLRFAIPYITQGLRNGWQRCPSCGTPRQMDIKARDEMGGSEHPWPGLTSSLFCPPCEVNVNTSLASAFWQHPEVVRFTRRYPRCVSEPEQLVEYGGQPAIRSAFAAVADGRRLTLMADRATLDVLNTHET